MFDKYKERFAKIEEDHENVRKFHQHVLKYQLYYVSGATALVSVAGMRVLSRPTTITNIVEQAPPVISPVFNNHNIGNVVNNTVNNAGHCCKIVQDLESGKLWPTAKSLAMEIAEEHSITIERARWLLSRHTNGAEGYETLFGKTYTNYGVGTTG